MQIKIKSLDQITAWLIGLVVGGILFSIVWWVGGAAYNREEEDRVKIAASAEAILEQSRKNQVSKVDHYKLESKHPDEPDAAKPKDSIFEGHFAYSGTEAPWRWSDLRKTWSICKTGKFQSPIDFTGSKENENLKTLKFHYQHDISSVSLSNQTLVAQIPVGSWVEYKSERFDLQRAYLRTPSEHRVNGLPYEMEVQLEHQDLAGTKMFISILYTVGKESSALSQLSQALPRYAGESSKIERFNWKDLLPEKKTYWNYKGSLTFPPCSEGIDWVVFTKTNSLSSKTLKAFEKLQQNNARPTWPINKRSIARSNR
ncbi:MAG: carbonic anhydrase family protein [Proteobacteria bacterium]|nr:carbonic anhydrase family protein [Pseudomonadota bacterium]